MALVSDGYMLTVTLVDSGTNIAVKNYELTAATFAAAQTDAADILTRLNAVTDAFVKGYSISERFIENTPGLPLDAEIEDRASIVLQLGSSPFKKAVHEIPAPVIGLFKAATGVDRNNIDLADVDLLAYLATFISGGEATLSDGEFIEATPISGKRIHVASRKG